MDLSHANIKRELLIIILYGLVIHHQTQVYGKYFNIFSQ